MRGAGAIASLFGGIWRKVASGGRKTHEVAGPRKPLLVQSLPPEARARVNELIEAKRKEIDPTGERLAAELARFDRPKEAP